MRRRLIGLFSFGALLVACGDNGTSSSTGSGGGASSTGAGLGGFGGTAGVGGSASTGQLGGAGGGGLGGSGQGTGVGGGAPCPSGVTCVDSYPFEDKRDTSKEGVKNIDSYDCSPSTNESGPEIYYRVTIPHDGFLSVAVDVGSGVDIDVQILSEFDPANPTGTHCLTRGDKQAAADVKAGYAWVVADTWTNSASKQFPGAYTLDVGFIPVEEGPCAMETGSMPRVGDGGNHLAMPATGPVVVEAHLVTADEGGLEPQTDTDMLDAHYKLSQSKTNLVMQRNQPWAPEEGGSFFGEGIGDPADLPTLDEGWYVNMYWTSAGRPPPGTRMILQKGDDLSRAVVVAAGYETGPGNLSHVAGTPEETHYYLGTQGEDSMKIGIATDQSLPLGPRKCK